MARLSKFKLDSEVRSLQNVIRVFVHRLGWGVAASDSGFCKRWKFFWSYETWFLPYHGFLYQTVENKY